MDDAILPPDRVRGMTVLDRDLFCKSVSIPAIELRPKQVSLFLKKLQDLLLRQPGVKHVQNSSDGGKLLLLSPQVSGVLDSAWVSANGGVVTTHVLDLTYQHWSLHQVLKAVLPLETKQIPSSFEAVGHIAHLNLSPDLGAYKSIIGQVLLDRQPQIRTVVNKMDNIDETFRFFKMELLAGDHDLMATVKENGCQFTFDYSKVYWNSRLGTEHSNLVASLHPSDIVVDVFAGVGPFSLPAAKKGCRVYANDLNPASFHYLQKNAEVNKLSIRPYNLDGREFILRMASEDVFSDKRVHVIMNLPASAVGFLDIFKTLPTPRHPPFIHCYHFSKAEDVKMDTVEAVSKILDVSMKEGTYTVSVVRDVAPKKLMVRMSFELPVLVLLESGQQKHNVDSSEMSCQRPPTSKRTKLDQN